jgi:serralysin
VLNGQRGNDQLYGLSGDDLLRGGAGNDILVGGTGRNYLTGNTSRDTFVVTKDGYSYVTDFTRGQDAIKLASGLTLDQLRIERGTGRYSNQTWIKLASDNSFLMALTDVQTSGFVKKMNSNRI